MKYYFLIAAAALLLSACNRKELADSNHSKDSLEAVVNEAREKELTTVLELALHDRSTVAYARGRYTDALEYAYDALELAPVGTERDALLGDMGTIFGDIGLRDAARDAHLIVSATSQSQWLVAQAQST